MKSKELTAQSPSKDGRLSTPYPPPPLPPYLAQTEPQEIEDLPLQVSLLTMEVATLRRMMERTSLILETASRMMSPPGIGLND